MASDIDDGGGDNFVTRVVETREQLDPHADDAIAIYIPHFAIHVDICGGVVGLGVSRITAETLVEFLQQELAKPSSSSATGNAVHDRLLASLDDDGTEQH